MGQPQKTFLSFCNILSLCQSGLHDIWFGDLYPSTSGVSFVEGLPWAACWFRAGAYRCGTLCTKKMIHSEGWIPGIQTLRIRATGATPLKRHHRRRKMNVMSDIIKSNATHAVMCGAC